MPSRGAFFNVRQSPYCPAQAKPPKHSGGTTGSKGVADIAFQRDFGTCGKRGFRSGSRLAFRGRIDVRFPPPATGGGRPGPARRPRRLRGRSTRPGGAGATRTVTWSVSVSPRASVTSNVITCSPSGRSTRAPAPEAISRAPSIHCHARPPSSSLLAPPSSTTGWAPSPSRSNTSWSAPAWARPLIACSLSASPGAGKSPFRHGQSGFSGGVAGRRDRRRRWISWRPASQGWSSVKSPRAAKASSGPWPL